VNLGETKSAAFGALPAVGHVLRTAISERWLRIHSLPKSKRYADTDAEYAEVFRRHNEVALEILGSHAHAVLFLHTWGTAADFPGAFSEFAWAADLNLSSATPTVYPTPEGDDADLLVAGFLIHWVPRRWDKLLRDVADDRLPSVVVLNPTTREAYAPYDGGADLFLANSERVAELAHRWASWLSERPDGL
jgi:hypothetical protein